MSQTLTLKIAGLYTSPNDMSEVPEGALLEATNIVINQASLAEPRRGLDRITTSLGDQPKQLWFYKDKLFSHVGTSTVKYYASSTWNSVSGTFTAPTGTRIRPAFSNQNLYLTTSAGVYKFDDYNATARLAGAPKALDVQAAASASASTWLANNYRTAYRIVWGIKDANNNLILGAPSQRESYKNSSGSAKAVDVTFTIPASILNDSNYANWFYQVYRSSAVDNSAADTEPSDELQLVYEGNPTSSEITAKKITVTDITPDALRGATIYTAQSQEGLANGNEPPPLAKDIAVFKDTMFFANVTSKHRLYMTLLSVSGSGIVNDDTVTVGGVTYTGKASETIASAQFQVVTGGTAAQNIRDTALSLVRVINRYTSSTVYAYYLSGPDDLPGKILFEERSIGGAAFTFTSSRYAAWNPTISASSPTRTSSNDNFKNGIFYGKSLQPEHTPLVNFTEVGSKDQEILRIVPLRTSLFVFKEDGIYRGYESGSGFAFELFDSSAKLIAPESCAVLNNQIYCLTDQGVTVVTDTGVSIVSRPIESDLLSVFGYSLDNVKSLSFGVAYESERKYILFTIGGSGDTYPTQAYVWNTFTSTWTKWDLSKTCGVVGGIDARTDASKELLYLGNPVDNVVDIERKALNYTDYADYGFTTTISSVDGTSVVVSSGSDNIAIGDVVYQDATHFAIVTAVNSITSTVTLNIDASFSVGAVTIYKRIETSVKWAPISLNNTAILKQFQEVQLIFKSDFAGSATLSFSSDLSIEEQSISLTGNSIGLWGLFTWGGVPWGGDNQRKPVRQWVPRPTQVGSYLIVTFEHAYGYTGYQLAGISMFAETLGSSRVRR